MLGGPGPGYITLARILQDSEGATRVPPSTSVAVEGVLRCSHSLYSVAVVDSIGKAPVDIEGVAVTFIHRGLVELIGMRAEAFPCIGSLSNPYCFVATLYVSNFALAFPQPVLIAQ